MPSHTCSPAPNRSQVVSRPGVQVGILFFIQYVDIELVIVLFHQIVIFSLVPNGGRDVQITSLIATTLDNITRGSGDSNVAINEFLKPKVTQTSYHQPLHCSSLCQTFFWILFHLEPLCGFRSDFVYAKFLRPMSCCHSTFLLFSPSSEWFFFSSLRTKYSFSIKVNCCVFEPRVPFVYLFHCVIATEFDYGITTGSEYYMQLIV